MDIMKSILGFLGQAQEKAAPVRDIASGKPAKITTPKRSRGSRFDDLAYSTAIPKQLIDPDTYKELLERAEPHMADQRDIYDSLLTQFHEIQAANKKRPEQTDLSKLLLAADVQGGTAFSKLYKAPKSAEERRKELMGLESSLLKLSHGNTKAFSDFIKGQFQPTDRETIKVAGGGGKGLKELPPKQLEKMASFDALEKNTDAMLDLWSNYAAGTPVSAGFLKRNMKFIGSQISSVFDIGSTERRYVKVMSIMANRLAKDLEGKVTDKDFARIIKFLPEPGETMEGARLKVDNMKREIETARASILNTFGKANYNVEPHIPKEKSGGKTSPAPAKSRRKGKRLTPKMSIEEYMQKRAKENK